MLPDLRVSEWIVVGYMLYLIAASWVLKLPGARRRLVSLVAPADIGVVLWLATASSSAGVIARDWSPALHILIGYWLSGALFQKPMLRIEAWLASSDRWLFERLGARWLAERGPRALLEYFELAYLTVYLVIPLAFAVPYFMAPAMDIDRYWTIVLIAELVCYGMLPWIQTRPPRALRLHAAIEDRRVGIHRLNGAILKLGSIQVNTFPSGHAAGAFATSLAVSELVPSAGLPLIILASSITIGSVIGRYHYAADSAAGVLVAVIVWSLVR